MNQRRMFIDRVTDEDVRFVLAGGQVWMTRSEIADALHVSKNKTLINLLEQMCADGYLERRENVTINRAVAFEYRIAQDHA